MTLPSMRLLDYETMSHSTVAGINAWHAFKFHELIMMELFCYSIRYEHAKRHYVVLFAVTSTTSDMQHVRRSTKQHYYYNIYYKQFTFLWSCLLCLSVLLKIAFLWCANMLKIVFSFYFFLGLMSRIKNFKSKYLLILLHNNYSELSSFTRNFIYRWTCHKIATAVACLTNTIRKC